jgi:hypothetical protein
MLVIVGLAACLVRCEMTSGPLMARDQRRGSSWPRSGERLLKGDVFHQAGGREDRLTVI